MNLQELIKKQKEEDNLPSNFNLGLYWYNNNNFDEALTSANKALEHDVNSYEANRLKSDILFKISERHFNTNEELKILEEALIHVEKANEINEKNEDSYYMGTSDVKRRIEEIKAKK